MRHKIITFALLLPLLLTACSKDYFSELKHPLEIQGSFDPVYAIPVAKLSANMATIIGMIDTNQAISVRVGDDDVVSLRYDYYQHAVLDWVADKGSPAKGTTAEDTMHYYKIISGVENIDLFEKIKDYDTNTFRVNQFLINLETDVQGFVNSSFQEVLAEGCNLSFDSLVIKIKCIDGFTETLPLDIPEEVSVTELLAIKHLTLLENYNFRQIVEHKPSSVEYDIRLCVTLPVSQMLPGSTFQEEINKIGVDSIAADISARLELPLSFYGSNIKYIDTLDLNLSSLHEELQRIDQDTIRGDHYTAHLNDSTCFLAFIINNGLPLGVIFDVTFLDQDNTPILSTVFEGNFALFPAPVTPLAGYDNTYVANGAVPSELKMPISLEKLRNLSNTRKMVFDIRLNTSNPGIPGPSPFIAIRSIDRLDIRSYIVISPHADFALPIDLPDIPFIK